MEKRDQYGMNFKKKTGKLLLVSMTRTNISFLGQSLISLGIDGLPEFVSGCS